jgi:16S rRNA (guanine527-N7)-methyltransferase
VTASQTVEQLAERHQLTVGQCSQLAALLAVLAQDPHAPSAVTDAGRAATVHLADSLSALELPAVTGATRIADIGSGAGFPGLPLAIALPSAQVALVESAARKCAYLERVCSTAGIGNATVVATRAETWTDGAAQHDLVTARAVASLAVLCEYAAPLLRLGGALVAWKGPAGESEAAAALVAAGELGLTATDVVRVAPYPGSEGHRLFVYAKTAETPARFPRRPGMARKHPLGVAR